MINAKPAFQQEGAAVWNLGFRPFYLAGAAWAIISIALWILQWQGVIVLRSHLAGTAWHMHEMIFGYAFAVVAGFLLTAVRAWTNQPTPTGSSLMWIVVAWLFARVLYLTPWSLAGIVFETLFFIGVAWGIAVPIHRGGNRQNFFFVMLIAFAALLNLVFHYSLIAASASIDLRSIAIAGLDLLCFIITIVSGRVMPMFTRNGAPGTNPKSYPQLEKAALIGIFCTGVLSFVTTLQMWLAPVAFITSGLLFTRWVLCSPLATWRNPILWILHASLLWLPIGYALRAFAAIYPSLATSIGVHAITIGVIGGLTLAMMTRTARGHTGRNLRASKLETVAYLTILASACIRVFMPMIAPTFYIESVLASSLLWAASFSLYLWVFTPWLLASRLDGKAG